MLNWGGHIIALILLLSVVPNVGTAVELSGVVNRNPAVSSQPKRVDRYRGKESPNAKKPIENCRCQPNLFAVISLEGENLPPLGSPDEIPAMAQQDKQFVPSVMAVTVGTTVEFPNLDPFFHNVFSYSKTKRFDLGRYSNGESHEVTFDRPGLISVFCEIHFSMRAYVHVLSTPYFAVSNERGEFRIPGVQPGTYTARVWQENQPDLLMTVTVKGDSTFVILQ